MVNEIFQSEEPLCIIDRTFKRIVLHAEPSLLGTLFRLLELSATVNGAMSCQIPSPAATSDLQRRQVLTLANIGRDELCVILHSPPQSISLV
jgi:hypothetical protein